MRNAGSVPRGGGLPLRVLVVICLGGPVVWAAHFLLSYLGLTLACAHAVSSARAWLIVSTGSAGLLAALPGLGAWRLAHRGAATLNPSDDFLLQLGLSLSAFATVVLGLEGLAFVTLAHWCDG